MDIYYSYSSLTNAVIRKKSCAESNEKQSIPIGCCCSIHHNNIENTEFKMIKLGQTIIASGVWC